MKSIRIGVVLGLTSGYDSKHGDWEYSVIDAQATHVLARGHVESCASCHDDYAKSDFVTRTYMKKQTEK